MPHLGTTIGGIEYFMPLIPAENNVLFHFRIDSTTSYTNMAMFDTGVSGTDSCKVLVTWNMTLNWLNSESTYQHVCVLTSGSGTHAVRFFYPKTASNRVYLTAGSTSKTINRWGSVYSVETKNNCAQLGIGPMRLPAERLDVHYLDVWIWS